MIRHRENDEGQTSVFVIGVTVVILLFALTITAIMSVNLQHRKLLSLADSAAQSAATAFTIVDPNEFSVTITDASASQQVNEHLRALDAEQHFPNIAVQSVRVIGETTVQVRLRATAHPPIVNWVIPDGVTVVAEGTARTQLNDSEQ
ncbi:Tad domain-containing protein [Yaniella halotolerans]|uniref:Tad domain-containing protein n=1 Tax=Yaniella halotolerans TaxID=225453 RepID=UPI0003B318C7|nr:Tad domain-containing protein [Yaniella halotolerans]